MLIKEQTYGFFIPCVSLMGIGCHKELGSRIKSLGGRKPLLVTKHDCEPPTAML